MNWKNFWICFMLSLGQLSFAYPAEIIGPLLGTPEFLRYMRLVDNDGKTTAQAARLEGAMSGVFQAGAFFGILLGSHVMDRWGRKAGVVYCSSLGIIGGILLCAAQGPTMFIVFRFIAGAGSWGFFALIPVYTSELAPPSLRGFFVGMNGVLVATGYATGSFMALAFSYSSNPTAQWRGPLGIALFFPLLMLGMISFLPESPRWLMMVDRTEEAREIIMKLHGGPQEHQQEFARGEFVQIQRQTDLDKRLPSSWLDMMKRPSYRKRALIACTFAFLSQSTAVLVINNYSPSFYGALGFNARQQMILLCGWNVCAMLGNFTGAFLADRVGRRPLMMAGMGGCCASLVVEAAMVASFASPLPAHPNKAALGVGVAAFYVFIVMYACGIDAVGTVFYGELFPNHIRAKGLALAIATYALTDLVYLEVTATAFASIGWKYFLVFIVLTFLGTIWVYFFIPEMKKIPLEEVAKLFGDTKEVMADNTLDDLVLSQHVLSQHVQSDAKQSTEAGSAEKNAVVVEHCD